MDETNSWKLSRNWAKIYGSLLIKNKELNIEVF